MNQLLIAGLLLFTFGTISAQHQTLPDNDYSGNKIVIQVVTEDTVAHKALMKQLNNITSVAADTEIEVVCHGPGLYMLVKERSIVQAQLKKHAEKGIQFVACEFSLKERKVDKSQIVDEANFARSGALEIASKQRAGWSYLKAGF